MWHSDEDKPEDYASKRDWNGNAKNYSKLN
jgi:hypothetical protein